MVGVTVPPGGVLLITLGDTLIFIFKENSVAVVARRPLGAPGNMIVSQEQRGKLQIKYAGIGRRRLSY